MSGVRIPPTGASQAPECRVWLRPVAPTPVRLLIGGASPPEVAVSTAGFDFPPAVEPVIVTIPPVRVVPIGIVDEAVPCVARHRRCSSERTGGEHQCDESLMHPPGRYAPTPSHAPSSLRVPFVRRTSPAPGDVADRQNGRNRRGRLHVAAPPVGEERRAAVPQLASGRELDRSQLTNRNPPGASNFGSPGAGVIWSCSSSILFLEQSQQARA